MYYYNKNQIVETRDGSGNLKMQVYHGTRYIDEVVGLRLEHGRVYAHQDANYNVTALTDLTGRVLERYYYSPYGQLEVVVDAHFFDYDDDGDVDADDIAAATSGGDCWGDYSGDCRRLDADCDRDIDVDDHNAIVAYADTLSTDTEIQRIPAATESALGNPFAHQGLAYDAEIGSYQNRHRQYAPKLKRFMRRDPLSLRPIPANGYQDGLSLYGFAQQRPTNMVVPMGLTPCSDLVAECFGAFKLIKCMACGLTSDAPENANDLVQQWMDDNNEADPCRVDAMQHCVGGALAADDCGASCALCLGELNEILQADQDPMDFHNNAEGADCATTVGGNPVLCCEMKLNSDPSFLDTSGNCQ